MKKHKLFKTIAIAFLILMALTWIIPIGSYSGTEFTKGTTSPMGLVDLFRLPVLTIANFVQYALCFLAIGGFYGVLEKTGVLSPLIDKIVKKMKGKESLFLIITIVTLSVLASLSGLSMLLFVFVPFLIAVILVMGMSKITAVASTVGSILIGLLGSTYGFNISGYIKYNFSLGVNDQIFTKFILLAMIVFLFVMFVIGKAEKELANKKEVKKVENKDNNSKKNNKSKKEEKKETVVAVKEEKLDEIPFYKKNEKTSKSTLPMISIVLLTFVLALLMMFDWVNSFGIKFFTDIYTSLMEINIGDYQIVSNILGTVSQFGYWSNYELAILLSVSSLLIGWIYSIKFNDIVDSFFEGAKKMGRVAFYATLCLTLYAVMLSTGTSNIFYTIMNFLLGAGKTFNVFMTAILGFIGGAVFGEFPYLTSIVQEYAIEAYDATTLPVVGLVLQSMYGFAMLLFPTSMMLIAGLSYVEVSYKEWIKYIWKFLLSILAIILIVLVIATLFI